MSIQEIKNNYIEALSSEDAALAIRVLNEIKKSYTDNSEITSLVPKLQFVRMMSLTESQFLNLLEKNLPDAYGIVDFDLAEKIKQYAEQIELFPAQINFLKNLRGLLRKDDAMLGNGQIKVGPRLVDPTVGNWIYDYEQTPAKNPFRTEFDELSYVNSSQNARVLSEPESKILLNILKLYDFVNNTVSEWDATPEYDDPSKVPGKYDLYEFIPGLISEQDISQYSLESSATPAGLKISADEAAPVVAEPTRQTTPVSMDSARKDLPGRGLIMDEPVVNPEPLSAKSLEDLEKFRDADTGLVYETPTAKMPNYGLEQANYEQATARPDRNAVVPLAPESKVMQDINRLTGAHNTKRGIVLDRTSNVKVDELTDNLAKQKEQTNSKIKQKLEELRQRKS